jgi:UDP-N-acetylglucosamine 1-carboxyvinyltransferase
VHGTEHLKGFDHEVVGDYLQAGTYALASALTSGDITLTNFVADDLELFWLSLKKMGLEVEINYGEGVNKDSVRVLGKDNYKNLEVLKTAVHPGFPTDLQAPFVVLLTQGEGESVVFETLFEGRLNYLFELEKMGAKVELLNPHQAVIYGPTKLKGMPISSCDIRAGAAMVLAALVAEGETEISNINYIDRGYENLEEILTGLGGIIRRV